MGSEAAAPQGDYNEHPDAMDKRFARFGLRPLSDSDVWALSMAAMVMPDGNPGAEGYLAQVSGTTLFAGRLTVWGRVVAIGIAEGQYKGRSRLRRRTYVEGYDEAWGRYAVADGLTLALYGQAPGIVERCSVLGCGHQPYQRVRDFVGGALVNAIAEFRVALEWATGSRRDRVLSGRWEGITGANWDGAKADAIVGWERGDFYPMFAPGCAITPPCMTIEKQDMVLGSKHGRMPETLYLAIRPTNGWNEAQARWTKQNCPARTIYPATETSRLATDE